MYLRAKISSGRTAPPAGAVGAPAAAPQYPSVCFQAVAFATIRPELRPDGSSLMALVRNLGGSFGISFIVTMLARNQQVSHSDIAANVTPGSIPGVDLPSTLDRMPGIGGGLLGAIDGEVSRQAAMVAYLDNFYAMFWVLLLMAPMPFLLKKSRIAGLTERMPAE